MFWCILGKVKLFNYCFLFSRRSQISSKQNLQLALGPAGASPEALSGERAKCWAQLGGGTTSPAQAVPLFPSPSAAAAAAGRESLARAAAECFCPGVVVTPAPLPAGAAGGRVLGKWFATSTAGSGSREPALGEHGII